MDFDDEQTPEWPHRNFADVSTGDVRDMVALYPLAWIVSQNGDVLQATPMPVRAFADKAGKICRIDGHLARSNSHLEALRETRRALFLFMGPNGYVSPSWFRDRTQAPTWNYAAAQFMAEMVFFDDAGRIEPILRDLVQAMEAGRPRAWQIEEMGPRFHDLARGVVGFEAKVLETRVKFKLSQDERDEVCADIVAGLEDAGNDRLAALIRKYNDRPASD